MRAFELRRIDGRKLNHRHVDVVVVEQFGSDRLRESAHGELRPAVRRLERDAAVRQRRPYLHQRPAGPLTHPLYRHLRAVHCAEVRHLRDPFELLGSDVRELREDGGHRVVHPDVDGAELLLDAVGRPFHLFAFRDVGPDGQRLAARRLDVPLRALKSVLAEPLGDPLPTPDVAPVTMTTSLPPVIASPRGFVPRNDAGRTGSRFDYSSGIRRRTRSRPGPK